MKCFLLVFTLLIPLLTLFGVEKSMLIMTTEKIVSASKQLPDFVKEKEKRGFKIRLVTEKAFGGAGKVGQEKALVMRKWLRKNHEGFSFLLLIGESDAHKGDLPMMEMWPLHMYPDDGQPPYPANDPVQTDSFYADLTGNWDLNGNGKYGETEIDSGDGGIDFKAELIVGRIPVYGDRIDELDKILANTIDFMNRRENEIAYRNKFLFPAGFYFFRGQLGNNDDWDSAGLGEWFIQNFLKDNKDFSYTTMYEQEGIQKSKYHSDLPLTRKNMIEEWSKGYGVIFWGGHTFPEGISRSFWREDSNGDNKAERSEMKMEWLFRSTDAASLDGSKPAFLIAPNCLAGVVKDRGNVTHELLKNGIVGAMAATEASTPSDMVSKWDCYDCEWEKNSYGSDTAGVFTSKAIVEGGYPAEGLFYSKAEFGKSHIDGLTYANKMMFNWYGDPSLRRIDTARDIIMDEPEENPDADSVDEKSEEEDSKKSSSGCSLAVL